MGSKGIVFYCVCHGYGLFGLPLELKGVVYGGFGVDRRKGAFCSAVGYMLMSFLFGVVCSS